MSNAEILKLVRESQGFHRPNLFRVEFVVPPGINFNTTRFSGSAVAAPIPGFSIADYEHNSGGKLAEKHAASISYNSVNINFLVSKDFNEHKIFQDWRDLIIDADNRLGYFDEYTTDIIVTPTDRNGKDLVTFRLLGAKPETVGNIDMSYDTENSLSTLSVGFTYTRQDIIS